MLHFFRSNAYTTDGLYDNWIKISLKQAPIVRIAGRVIVLGDHSKVAKEGRYMPDIQVLHQESDNAGKPEFIEGHNFGQVSAVITNGPVSRSLPLRTELQKSPPKQEGKNKNKGDDDSLVVQMINLVNEAAKSMNEPVIAALDAYFSSKYAWFAADKTVMENGERLIEIVTRAQSNTVAFMIPETPKKKKRGQPRKYGNKIILKNLFSDMSDFTETTMMLYGRSTKVKYLCLDLMWKPVRRLVRFVCVSTDRGNCVLMSTSLTLNPEDIITVYALRFKIETSFDEQKNDMGCFAYHFWTTALPKRKHWAKSTPQTPDLNLQKRIDDAKHATESFVCLSTIATGILSIIAFSHSSEIWKRYPGWIKTLRSVIPTIATVRATLAKDLLAYVERYPYVSFCSIIKHRQRTAEFLYEDVA